MREGRGLLTGRGDGWDEAEYLAADGVEVGDFVEDFGGGGRGWVADVWECGFDLGAQAGLHGRVFAEEVYCPCQCCGGAVGYG